MKHFTPLLFSDALQWYGAKCWTPPRNNEFRCMTRSWIQSPNHYCNIQHICASFSGIKSTHLKTRLLCLANKTYLHCKQDFFVKQRSLVLKSHILCLRNHHNCLWKTEAEEAFINGIYQTVCPNKTAGMRNSNKAMPQRENEHQIFSKIFQRKFDKPTNISIFA